MNLILFLLILLFVVAPVGAAYFLWRLTRNAPRRWKLALRIPSVVLICVSASVLLLFVFVGMMCGRYEFAPAFSDDGKVAAQVVEEDCGATDAFHSSVRLWRKRPVSRLFDTIVFNVDNDPRRIYLTWKDARTLVIHYPNDSVELKGFSCQSEWQGIHVECVEYGPDYNTPVGKMPAVHRWPW
jgi:hypothetical protein